MAARWEGRRVVRWVGQLERVVDEPLGSEVPRPDFAAAAAAAAAYAAAAAEAAAAKAAKVQRRLWRQDRRNWLPLSQFGPILGPGGVEPPWPHQVPYPKFAPLGLVIALVGPPRV